MIVSCQNILAADCPVCNKPGNFCTQDNPPGPPDGCGLGGCSCNEYPVSVCCNGCGCCNDPCQKHFQCICSGSQDCGDLCYSDSDCKSGCDCEDGACVGDCCGGSSGGGDCGDNCSENSDCDGDLKCRSGKCRSGACPLSEQTNCVCDEDETHKECDGDQCKTVDGAGSNQCSNDDQCAPSVTHRECSGNQCITVDGSGTNECSGDGDCVACEGVSAPSNFQGTETCDTGISFTWEDNSDNENGFRVYKENIGNWCGHADRDYCVVGTVGQNVTSYDYEWCDDHQAYKYYVRSYIDCDSAASDGVDERDAYTCSSCVPALPTAHIQGYIFDASSIDPLACIGVTPTVYPGVGAGGADVTTLSLSCSGVVNPIPTVYTWRDSNQFSFDIPVTTDPSSCTISGPDYPSSSWTTGLSCDKASLPGTSFSIAAGETISSFDFGAVPPQPWWQSELGDVWSNGSQIRSLIPASCVTDPNCDSYITLDYPSPVTAVNGILITATGTDIDAGSGEASQTQDWKLGGASSYLGGTQQDYDYWQHKLAQYSSTDPGSSLNLGGQSNTETTIYSRTGDLDLSGSLGQAGQKVIVMATGNITIPNRITVADGAVLMAIAGNDIIINYCPTADSNYLDGIYLATNNISIEDNCDYQLEIKGGLIAFNTISSTRNFNLAQRARNIDTPILKFTHRPDFVLNAPPELKTSTYNWQEVRPRLSY